MTVPPRLLFAPALLVCALALPAFATGGATSSMHVTPSSPTGRYAEGASLVSGRLVDPPAPRTTLGDFPLGVVLSPNGRTAVVSNGGEGQGAPEQGDQSLQVVDVATGRVVQTIRDHQAGAPTFYNAGLAWSPDGRHLYATGGGNDQVYDYAVTEQRLSLAKRFRSSAKAGAPTVAGAASGGVPGTAPVVGDVGAYSRGLAITGDGGTLVVTNEQGGTVAGLNAADGTLRWETTLGGAGQGGGAFPGAVTVHAGRAYVTEQGLNTLATLDTATGALISQSPVGDHPTAVAVTKDGRLGFVTNSNDDSVSVLDLTAAVPTQVRQLSAHLMPGEANGSTPDAVTIDDAQHLVYVALAGDNTVAVLGNRLRGRPAPWNPVALRLLGDVPTGAYPTGVAVVPATGRLLAVAAKGFGGVPVTNRAQYDGNDIAGLLTTVPRPSPRQLAAYTRTAQHGLTYPSQANARRPEDSPVPDLAHAGTSPIKHVVMVVRENRTFDQVFGDLPKADADPAYLEFGERDVKGQTITPNVHALARRFGLSQNFYSDGEASIQGHHWTAEGTSSDYVEKSWLHYYSNRNHPYDPGSAVAYPRCGAIFQQLAGQGKTFRNFGELIGLSTAQTPTVTVAPGSACGTPGGVNDPTSVANFSSQFGANVSLTSVPDTMKEAQFEREYAPLVAANAVPQFSYVVLGNDHTDGTAPGKKTPQALVATNDQAVGKLVDYLSHTPQWASTAVFVVEDDSQDGLDHRDGHRNIALLASPYAKPGALSSLHISQASVLHTIELLLGIAPLSSYTQYAPVPYDLFTATPDLRPYTALMPTYPQSATNPAAPTGTASSVRLRPGTDLAGPVLEAQLWEATHPGRGMPTALLRELASRGGVSGPALAAWRSGRPCSCFPLRPGLLVAPGQGSDG